MVEPIHRLFVYGTLSSDSDNIMAEFLQSKSELIGPGQIKGDMYLIGFYPGVVQDPNSNHTIYGEVFTLHDPIKVFKVLDQYEGYDELFPETSLFVRKLLPVQYKNMTLDCWVYVFNQDTVGYEKIESGRFSDWINQ